jgi:hypothetical protein
MSEHHAPCAMGLTDHDFSETRECRRCGARKRRGTKVAEKNLRDKIVKRADAYEVYAGGGWVFHVRRHYQSTSAERANPYARVLCDVVSPACPDGETGDTYLSDIRGVLIRHRDMEAIAAVSKGAVR